MLKNRMKLLIAPDYKMLGDEKLVTDLPYDSIDIVFNRDNVWANHQNHHPACMTYDFDGNEWDDDRGSKWLKYKEEGSKDMPEYIDIDVVVPAVLKPKIVDGL